MKSAFVNMMGLAALLAVAAAADRPAMAGSVTYEIDIQTTAAGLASGPGGAIDLALNPNSVPPASTVSAKVFGATMDATTSVGAVTYTEGDVTGRLPGTVQMDNAGSTMNNELTQDYTVGSSPTSFFDVFVTLTGPEIGGGGTPPASGTVFNLAIYDSTDPSNGGNMPAMATLLVNPDGTITAQTSSQSGSGVTIAQAVPEPSGLILIGLGVAGIPAARRLRKLRTAA